MSLGKKSPLYRPVTEQDLPPLSRRFLFAQKLIPNLFDVLTNGCRVEILLFVTIIDMIDRFLSGQSAGIRLSAIRKDGSGKMQTADMELVHDVLVELQMAGLNFRNLQRLLRQNLNAELCFMHSCGSDLVPIEDVDSYYASILTEQILRTELDWSGSSEKNVTESDVFRLSTFSEDDYAVFRRVIDISFRIIDEPSLLHAA